MDQHLLTQPRFHIVRMIHTSQQIQQQHVKCWFSIECVTNDFNGGRRTRSTPPRRPLGAGYTFTFQPPSAALPHPSPCKSPWRLFTIKLSAPALHHPGHTYNRPLRWHDRLSGSHIVVLKKESEILPSLMGKSCQQLVVFTSQMW